MHKQKQNKHKLERRSAKSKQPGNLKQARKRLASHPDTSPELLSKMADKAHPEILERVAENVQATAETLEKLSMHESPEIRGAVADNLNVAPQTLQTLAADSHPDVRYRLAENANTPVDILKTLAEDENPYVASRAKETLKGVTSVSERADELLLQEQFVEAESLYKNLVLRLEELIGSNHREVALALHKLAAALVGQGKMAEAATVEERAKNIVKAHESSEKG